MKCPVCGKEGGHALTETCVDTIGGGTYSIFLCGACGVYFADPFRSPSASWYAQAEKLWAPEACVCALPPWRLASLKRAARPAAAPLKLLDLGCGDGAFMLAARQAGFEVYGIDFSADKIKAAKASGLSGASEAGFDGFFSSAPDSYDVISFFQVLEHLENPSGFVKSAARLLRPGGILVLDIPDAQRPLPSASGLIDKPPHHLTRWSKNALRHFLEAEGFEILEIASQLSPRLLADTGLAWITVSLARLREYAPWKKPAAGKTGGAGPAAENGSRRRSLYPIVKAVYFYFLLPLGAPFFAAWYLYLKISGRGFYISASARRRQNPRI